MGNDATKLSPMQAGPVLQVTLGPGGLISGGMVNEPSFKHAGIAAAEDSLFGTAYKPHGEEVSVEDVRELTEEEVVNAPGPHEKNSGSTGPAIRALRYQHHEIARLLAAGTKPSEIARVLDITVPTIAKLITTPQFQDLLHGYTTARDHAAIDIGVRLKVAGAIALDKLTEKLEGTPGAAMPADWLTKTTLGLVDRAGHAPVQRTFHASVSTAISPADIRAMRMERAARTVVLAPHTGPDGSGSAGDRQDDSLASSGTEAREKSLGVSLQSAADAMARDDAAAQPVVPEP
jgi:hypothetical protein